MLNSLQFFFLFMAFSEFILGVWGHGFLGLINCIHWIKRNKISLSDFIIMNLAFSRIFMQCVLIFDGVTLMLYPNFYYQMLLSIIREISWVFSNYLNMGLATCLSVFYCLKIATFSHPAFLWLKRRIYQVVACILLGNVLFSFFSTVMVIQKFSIRFGFLKVRLITNYTENVGRKEREFYVFHFLSFLWTLIPFIISLFSCLLLILSLRRHTRMMRHQVTVPRDVNTEAHVRATKVMCSFLLLFVFYFLLFFMGTTSIFLKNTKLIIIIIQLAAPVFPSIHTFILILQNKNLKQAFLKLLWLKRAE